MADRARRKGVIYKAVRTLSPVEAAYLGGLIDGEGTITLSRRHRDDERQLVVSISNNERAILEYVLHTVGAGRITGKRTYSEAHAPSFTYAIGNRQALDLLKQIAIYLQSYKSERAALALARYVALTPRNGKYTSALQADREKFIEEFLAVSPRSSKAALGACRTFVELRPLAQKIGNFDVSTIMEGLIKPLNDVPCAVQRHIFASPTDC